MLSLASRTLPKQSWKYNQLSDPGNQNHASTSPRRYKKILPFLLISILALFVGASVMFIVLHNTPSLLHAFQDNSFHCGNTSAEAISRGCTFDPVTVEWLPKVCPRDALDDFLRSSGRDEGYRYWFDEAGTDEIEGYEALSKIDGRYYWTTQREHVAHCKYMILRSYYVMARGDMVNSLSQLEHHWRHCLDYEMEVDKEKDDVITTKGKVGFGTCSYMSGPILEWAPPS